MTTLFAAACASGDSGAQGAKGPQGDNGPAGAAGTTGPQGASGLPGPGGPVGAAGSQGATGPTGDSATAAAPSVIIIPSAVETGGGTFTLRGAGFTPGDTIAVEILENGTRAAPPRVSIGASQTVNINGAFENAWSSRASSTPGFYTVFATDSVGREASVTLTIVAPKT
ncbi:MAG: hypothetical protein O6920_06125 [Chloroflexi bacterium]|nr:hypothetical protein [Chloroflexota bacterium]